jgi:hypothetical protein
MSNPNEMKPAHNFSKLASAASVVFVVYLSAQADVGLSRKSPQTRPYAQLPTLCRML